VLRGLASSVDPNGAALRALVAIPGRRPITHPPRLCGRRIRVHIIYTKRALPVGQRARGGADWKAVESLVRDELFARVQLKISSWGPLVRAVTARAV
jgi:hypothetical protein